LYLFRTPCINHICSFGSWSAACKKHEKYNAECDEPAHCMPKIKIRALDSKFIDFVETIRVADVISKGRQIMLHINRLLNRLFLFNPHQILIKDFLPHRVCSHETRPTEVSHAFFSWRCCRSLVLAFK